MPDLISHRRQQSAFRRNHCLSCIDEQKAARSICTFCTASFCLVNNKYREEIPRQSWPTKEACWSPIAEARGTPFNAKSSPNAMAPYTSEDDLISGKTDAGTEKALGLLEECR